MEASLRRPTQRWDHGPSIEDKRPIVSEGSVLFHRRHCLRRVSGVPGLYLDKAWVFFQRPVESGVHDCDCVSDNIVGFVTLSCGDKTHLFLQMLLGDHRAALLLPYFTAKKTKLGNLPKVPQEVSYRAGIKAQIASFLIPNCLLNFTQVWMGPQKGPNHFRSG